MSSRAALVLGVLMLAAGVAFLVERLIVTDREAILMAADRSAEAIGKGDVDAALRVLHPAALTDFGDAARTKAALEETLRSMPVERVNFLLRELQIENGRGVMKLDLMVIPKDPKKTGAGVGRFPMTIDWEKDGEEWKVRRASLR